MHRLWFLVLACLTLGGCVAAVSTTSIPPVDLARANELVYVSVEPISTPWVEVETSKGLEKFFWKEIDNKRANDELPLEKSFASITRENYDGSIGFASAKYSGEAGTYKVVLDYAKYREETVAGSDTKCRVGVGVRITSTVTTLKNNVDLGGIFALAFAAKQGYLSGQIEVLKIGINSPSLNLVLPPATDINDSSLQAAVQSVAAIRAKLYDKETSLTPHIIAVQKKI